MYIVVLINNNSYWYYSRLILDSTSIYAYSWWLYEENQLTNLEFLGIRISSNIKVLDSTSIRGLKQVVSKNKYYNETSIGNQTTIIICRNYKFVGFNWTLSTKKQHTTQSNLGLCVAYNTQF
jgi:hypothetical protein